MEIINWWDWEASGGLIFVVVEIEVRGIWFFDKGGLRASFDYQKLVFSRILLNFSGFFEIHKIWSVIVSVGALNQ